MAASADFKVILTIDSQGNAKIEEVKRGLQEIGDTATKSGQVGAASADEFAGALMRKLGVMALVTAGLYKLEQATVGAFKAGIQAVDDFKLATIGVAATITDLAVDQSKGQQNYSRALAYSKDMFNELELAAARYFASGKEMTQAWNILAQKGIVLKHEEIDALGIIVDRIKLSTQGQTSSLQIAQEMRSMITGQARATDQVGMLLKDRIPNLEEELKKHREIGDVVTWLASQFKGLAYASEDIQKTLESQKSTLGTLITQVGRGGLEGAYGEIVTLVAQINDYLLKHKDDLIPGIARGWEVVRDLAKGTLGFIKEIHDYVIKPLVWVIKVGFDWGPHARLLAEAAGAQGDFGFGALIPEQFSAAEKEAWNEFSGYEDPLPPSARGRPQAPDTKPGIGGDKGGKGGSAADRMSSILDRLKQDLSKLTEGSIAEIDAWAQKTVNDIEKVGRKGAETNEALKLVAEVAAAKKGKVEADFYRLVAKESGDAYSELDARYIDDFRKYQGITGAKEALDAMWYKRKADLDDKFAKESLSLQKGYVDQLAQASTTIEGQVALKEVSLAIQKKINDATFEKKLRELEINGILTDEIRGLHALAAQAEKYTQERQKQVDLGTLEGWAIERAGEALKRNQNAIKDMMTGLESTVTDLWTQGIQNAFADSGSKKSFKEIGKNIVQNMIIEMNKKSFMRVWDEIAKMIERAAGKSTTSAQGIAGGGEAGGGGPSGLSGVIGNFGKVVQQFGSNNQTFGQGTQGLTTASEQTSNSAGGLSDSSSLLSMSGIGLGLSAGGLLLSGIGIATGSQALVTAGGILQAAALAIQIAAIVLQATGFLPFHGGGLVAHEGVLVAHGGLSLDERLVLAQVGEGIIKRDTMAAYARRGISFEDLNAGRLPVVVGGQGGGGTVVNDNKQVHFKVVFAKGAFNLPAKMTSQEADRMVRRQILPALNKVMGNRALSLMGD